MNEEFVNDKLEDKEIVFEESDEDRPAELFITELIDACEIDSDWLEKLSDEVETSLDLEPDPQAGSSNTSDKKQNIFS